MNLLHFLTPKNDVAFLYDDFTVRQALEKMEYHRYSSIPILNRKGEYVGTITEGDLLWGIKRLYNLDLQAAEDIPLMQFLGSEIMYVFQLKQTWILWSPLLCVKILYLYWTEKTALSV